MMINATIIRLITITLVTAVVIALKKVMYTITP